ncbi:galectin [Aphelenchoides avenae]|nr:galectin [Aphelenchus avenae]
MSKHFRTYAWEQEHPPPYNADGMPVRKADPDQTAYWEKTTDYFSVPTPFSVGRRGFLPGERIRIVVTPLKGPEHRFHINLVQAATDTVIFHFNPRFNEKVVVMNSTRNGTWLEEHRPKYFPFQHNKPISMDFVAESAGIRVYLDGQYLATFAARDDLRYVDTMEVEGDVEIHCVTTNHS